MAARAARHAKIWGIFKKTPGSCKYAWKKFALFRNRALKRYDKNEASLERIRKFGNSEYYHTVFMCVLYYYARRM